MTSFVDLDSIWRDRITYPNPCDYEVLPGQITSWFRSAREVKALPQNTNIRPLEFSTNISLISLILPYDDDLINMPRLYVDFHSRVYNDRYLISTIDSRHPEARFIACFEKIQNDNLGNPKWIHYRSNMEQSMRFRRDDPVVFRITSRDGTILPFFIDSDINLPADPDKQSLATFSILPLIRDADLNSIDPVQQ